MTLSLNIGDIYTNSKQPRKYFNEDSLRELAESICADGLQFPILVRPYEGKFEIVQGERRYRACLLAGLETIQAEIRELSDDEAFHLAVIENIQREQLTDIEEAHAFQRYIEMGYTHDAVASKVKKSRTYVTTKLRLLRLAPQIQDLISQGQISTGHAVQVLKLESILERLCGELCFKGEEENTFSYFQGVLAKEIMEQERVTVADIINMIDNIRARFILAIIAVFNGRWNCEFERMESTSLTAHGYCMTYSLRIEALQQEDIEFLLNRMLREAESDPDGPERWEIYKRMDDLSSRLFKEGRSPEWPPDEIARRSHKIIDEVTGKFDTHAMDKVFSWQFIDRKTT